MQPYIYEGDSYSSPNGIGGVQEPFANQTFQFTPSSGETAGSGSIGRYTDVYDWFGQARNFYGALDVYARQHLVDAYRFELGNVGNPPVVQKFIDNTINKIDNCLARRVAYGIGAQLPAKGSGPMTNVTNRTTPYPSLYPLGAASQKSNAGLTVAVVASDTLFSTADMGAVMSMLASQQVGLEVVAPRVGQLNTGVVANASFIITSDIFYDAILIGSDCGNSSANALDANSMNFVMEAYGHGKAIAAIGSSGSAIVKSLGIAGEPGVYVGDAGTVTSDVLSALSGPVRFPQRFPTDDLQAICG